MGFTKWKMSEKYNTKQYATIFTNDDYITSFQVISSDGLTEWLNIV